MRTLHDTVYGSEEKGLLISSSKGVSIQSTTGIGLVGNVNVIGDLIR